MKNRPTDGLLGRRDVRRHRRCIFAVIAYGVKFGDTVLLPGYAMGTPARMGPAFFPFWLGLILFVLGIGIAVGGAAQRARARPLDEVPLGPDRLRARRRVPLRPACSSPSGMPLAGHPAGGRRELRQPRLPAGSRCCILALGPGHLLRAGVRLRPEAADSAVPGHRSAAGHARSAAAKEKPWKSSTTSCMGFGVALTFTNIMYCFIGVLLGTLIGVLPGIGPIATISMLLPATFVLPPVSALIMLAGIYYGAQYGGSTTAILVNLPGEVSSVVTCLDGYQMARRARRARRSGIAALLVVLRGHRGHVPHRRLRAAARRARAQVRARRLLLADGAGPDRGGGARARLAHQGDRDDRAGAADRPHRHRRELGRGALQLRPARADRRRRHRRRRHGRRSASRRSSATSSRARSARCSPRASRACCPTGPT